MHSFVQPNVEPKLEPGVDGNELSQISESSGDLELSQISGVIEIPDDVWSIFCVRAVQQKKTDLFCVR